MFKDAGGLLRNVTYTGNYNQIGKMMFYCVNVQFNSLAALGTTQYQITLPKPARQTFTSRGGTLHNPTTDARYHIAGILDTMVDNVTLKFYYSGSTTDLAWKNTTPAGWASPSENTGIHFDLSGFYEIE